MNQFQQQYQTPKKFWEKLELKYDPERTTEKEILEKLPNGVKVE